MYKYKFKNLCAGSAEDFIKWVRSMQIIFKGYPSDSAVLKFEMVGIILYGVIRNTWKAITTKHTSKAVIRTVRNKEGVETQKEMERGFTKWGLKTCLKMLS